eukprot:TRINITY_DN2675_c0_g2_i1.p1 TRINITY_DN2675_c0_g2~~TRINITY_DN2675_c0_g2_i1.p1  ORF type:complete len:317 (+),score=88.63 TRINITY_DN2675_c0_g2_i1:121-951(+)
MEQLFQEASSYLSNTPLNFSDQDKLEFYAFFKQATVGPCNAPKPAFYDFVGKAKWASWVNLGQMSKEVAMQRYVEKLDRLAPQWRPDASVPAPDSSDAPAEDNQDDEDSDLERLEADDDEEESKQSKPNPSSVTFSKGQSTLAFFDPQNPEMSGHDSPSEFEAKTIYDLAGEGEIEAVVTALEQTQMPIDKPDNEGRTLLHFAADRGQVEMVRLLLDAHRANPNVQDAEGSTPLHFACTCEFPEVAALLLQYGASADIADREGETPRSIAPHLVDL